MSAACSTCVYYNARDIDSGFCRRRPPPWYPVMLTDWCGDYQSSPPATQMPAVSGVAAAQPNITVVTDTMLGCGAIAGFCITPVRTGRVAAMISGTLTSSTANAQINITGRHDVGTAPANGAGATGQLWAATQHYFTSNAKDVEGFTVIGGNPNLALNVPIWFDVSVASPGGGITTIADVQSLLWEL